MSTPLKSLLHKAYPFVFLLLVAGCQKDDRQDTRQNLTPDASAARNGATTRTICFTGIAEVEGCIGENIVFGGTLELKEKVTVSNGQTHYTRHWLVKDATAMGVAPGGRLNTASSACPRPYIGTATGNTYTVVAGAEMFSVKDPNTTTGTPSAPLSGDVFIHQGTIVFENTSTGERIVVRHEIIKNPGQGIHKSGWYIRGKNCMEH